MISCMHANYIQIPKFHLAINFFLIIKVLEISLYIIKKTMIILYIIKKKQ